MPITFRIDAETGTLWTVLSGRVRLEDVERHLAEERDAGGLPYLELVDTRGAQVELTPADVRSAVETLRRLGKASALGPTAVIAGSDFVFGMFRMFEMLVEDVCIIRPFRDEAAALAWLASFRPASLAT